ncbi:MAG: hypothetical protein QM497_01665 [Sulfurimonas sp.]
MSEIEKSSHIITIMQEFLNGGTSSSMDAIASNRNQYYGTIKKHGIELIEVRKPNLTNTGTHKERRLHQSIENIKRAESYLNKLLGKNSNAVRVKS